MPSSTRETKWSRIQGTAVIQPLPSADRFEVVGEREGRERHLSVRRFAFVPVLGAEFIERECPEALVMPKLNMFLPVWWEDAALRKAAGLD